MKTYPAVLFVFAAVLAAPLPAKVAPPHKPDTTAAATTKAMNDAFKLRADMAAAIIKGSEESAAALRRLKSCAEPTGLRLERSVAFGFAAMDVGQRLLAAGQPAEAEKFFRAAEQSLDQAVKQTPDQAARDKAILLRKLSFLRGRYLNQVPQARADIEQAIALQPADQGLQVARASLATENGDYFRARPPSREVSP